MVSQTADLDWFYSGREGKQTSYTGTECKQTGYTKPNPKIDVFTCVWVRVVKNLFDSDC